jgi:hypothetical protein
MGEDLHTLNSLSPDDLQENVHLLPDRPKSLMEEKYKTYFAVRFQGKDGNDMYVSLLPNQVCIVGLAPSNFLIRSKSKQVKKAQVATDAPVLE